MEQMIQSSAAMTKTMLGDAEVMPGLGPVPLLQRQSASESRWTRPVPTSRESARENLSGMGVKCNHPNWKEPNVYSGGPRKYPQLWAEKACSGGPRKWYPQLWAEKVLSVFW